MFRYTYFKKKSTSNVKQSDTLSFKKVTANFKSVDTLSFNKNTSQV